MSLGKVSLVAAALMMFSAVSCGDSGDSQSGAASSSVAANGDADAVEVPKRPTPALAGSTYYATLGSSRVTLTMPQNQGLEITRALSGDALWVSLRSSTFSATLAQGFLDNKGRPLASTADGVVEYLQTIDGLSIKTGGNETIGNKKATTVTFEHKGPDATLWHRSEDVLSLDNGQVGKFWFLVSKSDLLILAADYQATRNPEDEAAFAALTKSLRFE